MTLQVSRIKIKNMLGIESMEIHPGKLTVIRGRNGQGKTSVIESIKAALKGGHDATLLRNGETIGESVLVLDDGSKIAKRVTAEGSTLRMLDAEGERVQRAATEVAQLVDALSVNPIEFLTTPAKHQVAALLEAMPMKADIAKLAQITGGAVAPELAHAPALDAITAVHKSVYDNRTGINRSITEKKGTIAQLEAAIPAALADTDAVDENALEAATAAADAERDAELKRIDEKLAGMETDWQAKLDELQQQIDAVKADRERVRTAAEKQRQKAKFTCADAKLPINERLALIRANRDAAAKARATRETIGKMHDDLAQLQEQSTAATEAIAALESYKSELLASLPIPGLQVVDGQILYRDVPFDRINTAEQMKVAVEIAKLRAGKLGLICVDGIERLDAAAFEAFKAHALETEGVQFVVTRVDDCPLTVDTQP